MSPDQFASTSTNPTNSKINFNFLFFLVAGEIILAKNEKQLLDCHEISNKHKNTGILDEVF